MQYQIIIPVWNQADLTVKCLQSIKKYSKDYQVILVDNASDDESFETINETLITMPHVLIRNTVNTGFVKATNQGLYFSTAEYVVLMNNDTEAVKDWLKKLTKPFKQFNNVGLTGPRTTTKGSWQGNWQGTNGTLILSKTSMLAFFCTMIKREVIEKVGYLDEGFGVGFGDDDNYCNRAQKFFDLALVQDLVIPHHHRSTFKKIYSDNEIKEMQNKAMELFKQKKI